MTNPELFELLDRFERSSLQTLKLSQPGFTLELGRNGPVSAAPVPAPAAAPISAPAAQEAAGAYKAKKNCSGSEKNIFKFLKKVIKNI